MNKLPSWQNWTKLDNMDNIGRYGGGHNQHFVGNQLNKSRNCGREKILKQ